MAPQCSEPSRQAVLTLVESLLAAEGGLGERILAPHTGLLLEALRHIIMGAWTGKVHASSAACCRRQWVSHALPMQLRETIRPQHSLDGYGMASGSTGCDGFRRQSFASPPLVLLGKLAGHQTLELSTGLCSTLVLNADHMENACLQAPSKNPRTAQAASRGPKQGSRQGISRATGVRCLAIMEQVAAAVQDAGMGLQLADAMLPLLHQKGGSRWGREGML